MLRRLAGGLPAFSYKVMLSVWSSYSSACRPSATARRSSRAQKPWAGPILRPGDGAQLDRVRADQSLSRAS